MVSIKATQGYKRVRREKRSRKPRREKEEVSSSPENPREKREEMKWDEDKMRRGKGKDEEGHKSRQIAVSVMTSREQKAAYRERSSNIIAVGERQSESRERGEESRERLQIQPRAPCPQQLPSLTQDDGQPVDQQHRSEMQKNRGWI